VRKLGSDMWRLSNSIIYVVPTCTGHRQKVSLQSCQLLSLEHYLEKTNPLQENIWKKAPCLLQIMNAFADLCVYLYFLWLLWTLNNVKLHTWIIICMANLLVWWIHFLQIKMFSLECTFPKHFRHLHRLTH